MASKRLDVNQKKISRVNIPILVHPYIQLDRYPPIKMGESSFDQSFCRKIYGLATPTICLRWRNPIIAHQVRFLRAGEVLVCNIEPAHASHGQSGFVRDSKIFPAVVSENIWEPRTNQSHMAEFDGDVLYDLGPIAPSSFASTIGIRTRSLL